MATKTRTQSLPDDVDLLTDPHQDTPADIERETQRAIEMVPGIDVEVMPFTITILKPLIPGQPRGNDQVVSRQVIEIREEDVPAGSTPYIEAIKIAAAITPHGYASSTRPGQRQLRRVPATQARLVS